MFLKRFWLAFMLLLTLAPGAFAQQTPPATDPLINYRAGKEPTADKVPVLKSVIDFGAQLTWLGRWSGLDGWIALKGTDTAVFYTTQDGKNIISGMLYDDKGENITLKQAKAAEEAGLNVGALSAAAQQQGAAQVPEVPSAPAVPATTTPQAQAATEAQPQATSTSAQLPGPVIPPGMTRGEALYQALGKAHGFSVGLPNTPALMIIFDPNCPYCKRYYQALADGPVRSGKLHLQMIPVGLLSSESMTYATALLASPTPVTAFEAFISGTKTALSNKPSNEEATRKLLENMEMVLQWGIDGVPYSVYRDKAGKIKIVKAMPNDLNTIINDIGS